MRILQQTATLLSTLVFFSTIGFAQYYPAPSKADINAPNISPDEQQRRAQAAQMDAIRRQDQAFGRARAGDAPGGGYIPPLKTSREKEAEIRAKIKEGERFKTLLSPPASYYRTFAKQLEDGMHLSRIFVDKNCDDGKTVAVEEIDRCADVIPVKGGGSFYSFRFQTNNYSRRDEWWDIHFVDNKFRVGNDVVQGIIADLGEIELEEVKSGLETVKRFGSYEPKRTLAEIKEQNNLLEKGFSANGFTYSNTVAAQLNHTYVVRSVAYRLKEQPGWYLMQKTGIDLTVAFKIVGMEKDGSLIFLWRELKTETPRAVLDNTTPAQKN